MQSSVDAVHSEYLPGQLPGRHLPEHDYGKGVRLLELLDDFADEPPPSLYRVGDRVADKYVLLERLGLGGMGEVWAARSEALDTKVAIKLIRGGSQTLTGQRRLAREARATAKLAEPGIVRVFDFGTTERGEPFIVMEFLDGEDLAAHLEKRKRLHPTDAVRMLLPIVKALTVAHAAGMVHRDVKPENVFLAKTATGGIQPKLLDFGIAQLAVAEHLTCSGSTMGSPEYMSPEQARGDDVDMSADTWALSVVLYEAITGKSPFFGRNYNVVIQNILTKEPAPWPDFGDGSDDLFGIIKKGLEKNRLERWRTSKALGRALADWLSARGVSDDITGLSLGAAWGDRSTARLRLAQREPSGARAALLCFALVLAALACISLSWFADRATASRPIGPARRIFAVSASSDGREPSLAVPAASHTPVSSAEPIERTPSMVTSGVPLSEATPHSDRRAPSRRLPKVNPAPPRSSASPRSPAPSRESFRNPFE